MISDGRRKCPVLFWCILLAAAIPAGIAAAAGSVAAGPEIGQSIAQLADKRWAERSKGFYRLLKLGSDPADAKGAAKVKPWLSGLLNRNPQQADAIKLALMKTLEVEDRFAHGGASLPEEFTDYYGDLIQAVAALNDPRSVNALAGALGTGNMATSALVAFGDASVDAVVQQAERATDRAVRLGACFVLQKMADPANRNPIKDPEHKRKIQQALAGGPCSAGKKK